MYGAIIGDIVGSRHEFFPCKTKDFEFITPRCTYTDDTVMTVAVAKALVEARETGASFKELLVSEMQRLGRLDPHRGYGGRFASWLTSPNPEPYNSYGNGSAMRVSPCGLIAVSLEGALELARASAEVTHNHPEGIKGACAVAGAVFLAKTGASKEDIRSFVEDGYYDLSFTLDEIRPTYTFNETCQGSVPQAIACFLESTSYEDAIRNAISLGGDADTQAAIAGAIAWAYYQNHSVPETQDAQSSTPEDAPAQWAARFVRRYDIPSFLPQEYVRVIEELENMGIRRRRAYDRIGLCSKIPL